MDKSKIIRRLLENKFIKWGTKRQTNNKIEVKGTSRNNLINLDHADIIKYYNGVMRGIYNYYSIVHNMPKLAQVMWLLKESCGLTLAKKYNLRTLSRVYRKYGENFELTIKDSKGQERKIKLWYPESFKQQLIQDWSKKNIETIESPIKLIENNWNNKFTKSNLFKACIICGATEEIQMHHLRIIKTLRDRTTKLDFLTRQMQAINRKQIPLCQKHHIAYHNNTLTNQEIELINTKKETIKQIDI